MTQSGRVDSLLCNEKKNTMLNKQKKRVGAKIKHEAIEMRISNKLLHLLIVIVLS